MIRNPKRVIAVLILLLAIPLVVWLVRLASSSYRSEKEGTNKVFSQAVMDSRQLLRVTALEAVRSVPITREEKGVGVFALGYYRVRISYDVERLQYFISGDTLRLQLPPAEVSVLEHEEMGFEVLDVWGTDFWTRLKGARLSLSEENKLRVQAMQQLRAELYRDGTVERANEQAKQVLLDMLSLVPGTVIIEDGSRFYPDVCEAPNLEIRNK
ncbi:MAG: DUF4230 domain-containing protein [Porphyromonas sp.]|nr:DUF4230 domain-containing protein [Porphyromonas sp.]